MQHNTKYKRKYKELMGWKKAEQLYLMKNPLCVMCLVEGNFIPAVIVDHIKSPDGDSGLFWDNKNWQSLCKDHFDKKNEKKQYKIFSKNTGK